MRASKLQSLWIILKSSWVMVCVSSGVIYNFCFRGARREFVDNAARRLSEGLLRYVKVNYVVKNPHHFKFEPNKQYIIMCNHSSHYDIPLSYVALPGSIRMLAKKELKKVPFMGWAMRMGEFVFIDRHNRKQAIRDLERAKESMKSGIILWIAPEGTRSRTGELGPFKKGGFIVALQTGASILPVRIDGAYDVLPPKTSQFKLNQQVTVNIGQPIDASQYTLEQRDQLMADVRRGISEA